MMSPSSSSAPSTEPMTTPAIWPPVRPRRASAAAGMLVLPDDDVALEVCVTDTVTGCSDEDATIGRVTPLHRVVVLENTQQESVEFGEVSEQYEHSPPKFEPKPQLSG